MEPRREPDFIFMLTRNDRTVGDALERLDEAMAAGVRHIGFKDVGLSFAGLRMLADAIRAAGACVYLEVVSLDEASEAASARNAVELKVDYLLGGTRPHVVLPIVRGAAIRYYPFAGAVVGHPSQLLGTPAEITASARQLVAIEGVDGVDLLAYRAAGDVSALISQVCGAVAPKPVIVAGSIDRAERIGAVVRGQAAAFTVGTAALNGVFPGSSANLTQQLIYIQTTVTQIARRQAAGAAATHGAQVERQ
jgi:4-hydroxythreonine-4-phosphate dehydrogenase